MSKRAVVPFARTFTTSTPENATIGNSSTKIVDTNSSRKYAIFVNDSDETIYLSLGAAAVINKGIRLNASGGSFEINNGFFQGEVYGICTSGSKNLTYIDV